jgi:hypothetical protein
VYIYYAAFVRKGKGGYVLIFLDLNKETLEKYTRNKIDY